MKAAATTQVRSRRGRPCPHSSERRMPEDPNPQFLSLAVRTRAPHLDVRCLLSPERFGRGCAGGGGDGIQEAHTLRVETARSTFAADVAILA